LTHLLNPAQKLNEKSISLPHHPPPPLGRPAPEIDPHERHAHNWREPKTKRLEKEKKILVESGI
jgi:hypothetical protein